MGPDLELKRRSVIMEVPANMENGSSVIEPAAKHISCASNCKDNNFEMEALLHRQVEQANRVEPSYLNIVENGSAVGEPADKHQNCEASLHEQAKQKNKVEQSEVNIMGRTDPSHNFLVEVELGDVTENSSSFGNTASEDENDSTWSDSEVTSQLYGVGFGEEFRMRKKRLTSHWRTFIQPYMWRCRWVELQIRRLQSQAMKYDLQLAEINRSKHYKSFNFSVEQHGAKSFPFSNHSQRKKIMERKKRKRVEETIDGEAYLAKHNLFSYCGNKKSGADVTSVDDSGALGISTEKKNLVDTVLRDTDKPIELGFRDDDTPFEQILWKLGVLQSNVNELRTRLRKVMNENADKISSANELCLLVPCDVLTSSAQNQSSSPSNEERKLIQPPSVASQLMPQYRMGCHVKSESAILSPGGVTHLPDIIQNIDQSRVEEPSKSAGDGHRVKTTKEKPNNFDKVDIQPIEKLKVPKEEQESTMASVPVPEDLPTDDRPNPKIRSISKLTFTKNKRKRGRRKAGSGRWSRRSQEQFVVLYKAADRRPR